MGDKAVRLPTLPTIRESPVTPAAIRMGYRSAAAGCLLFSSALVEPVAVAVHFQNMDMVGQAIEQCAG